MCGSVIYNQKTEPHDIQFSKRCDSVTPVKEIIRKRKRLFDNSCTFLAVLFSASICGDSMQWLSFRGKHFRAMLTVTTKCA